MGASDRDGDNEAGAAGMRTEDLLREGNDFIRGVAGGIALDLATAPEGRAAGLSVEVSAERGVELRMGTGDELRIFAVARDDVVVIAWERRSPEPGSEPLEPSNGELGAPTSLDAEVLRGFILAWLSPTRH